MASLYRRKNGIEPPPRWQHPALASEIPLLRAAAERARQLGEANGWSRSTIRCAIDGLVVLLDGRPDGERVTLTEIRARTPRDASAPRVAEVLAGLGLLEDNAVPAVRSWIGRRTAELPPGFATVVRDWLLVLLDGDARSRPRSSTTIYVYCTAVEPLIACWSARPGTPPGGHHCRHPGRAGQAQRMAARHHDLGAPVPVPVRQEARPDLRQPRPAAEGRQPGSQPAADGRRRDPGRRAGHHPPGAAADRRPGRRPRRPVGGHSHAHPGRPGPAQPAHHHRGPLPAAR